MTLVALSIDAWFYPHYAAPIAGLLFALVVQGTPPSAVWRRRQGGAGLRLSRAIPAICLAMIAVRLAAQPLGVLFPRHGP